MTRARPVDAIDLLSLGALIWIGLGIAHHNLALKVFGAVLLGMAAYRRHKVSNEKPGTTP